MGGSAAGSIPSNVIVLCSKFNQQIESDARAAQLAISFGWKLEQYQDPEDMPVYDYAAHQWFYLTNDYQRVTAVRP